MSLILFLVSFWFLRCIKQVLFWVYLWQLKQYHIGRFLDHFRTEKGKKLLFHPLQIIKIGLLFLFLVRSSLSLAVILLLIYFAESLLYLRGLILKRIKNPVFTKKTIALVSASLLLLVALAVPFVAKDVAFFSILLLKLDILLPLMVSLVVILMQPLADHYRLSLQEKAGEKIKELNQNLTIIAITGSYGKTSVKEYLATILSERFKVLSTSEHQNTEVGIPLMILNDLNKDHEVLIVEMGAYDKGTIKRICDFIQPDIGIVTGVNQQHLSLFGSMDDLLSAEGGRELLQSLPKDGIILVNGENKYCCDLYDRAKIKKLSYSYKDVKSLKVEEDSVLFSLEDVDFKVNVLGKHNVLNLLGAIYVAKELGMDLKEISKAALRIKPFLKAFKNKNGVNIVDATYSSNPDGVIADLEYLFVFSGKKVIVMPCLIELGKAAKEVHQKIGRKIAEVCDLAIVTTKECIKDIKKGAGPFDVQLIGDTNLILGKINSFCKSGDAVLLEGRLSEAVIKGLK